MADIKLNLNSILKGSKLQVTVEESINDILLVCLNYESKIYRGVLIDVKKRNLPFGVSFPKEPQKPDPGGKNSVNKPSDGSCEADKGGICISATTQRHSYMKDPFEFTNKPLQLPLLNMIRRKTVRDIRLRPRKTLCTNCKTNIHETKLKHDPQNSTSKAQSPQKTTLGLTRSTRLHPQTTSSPSMQLRKRQLSTDDESPSRPLQIQTKVGRMNLSPRLMTNKSSYTCSKSYSRNLSCKQKSTPAIKISIGGDSVLNIPPRISENETFKTEIERAVIKKELTVRLTDIAEQANAYTALRKVKKSVKKSKDREKDRDIEIISSETDLNEEKIDIPIAVVPVSGCDDETPVTISSHTKKHKRKHKHERHRHSSLEDFGDNNNSNLCSLEWQGSPKHDVNDFLNEISEEFEEDTNNENNIPVEDDTNTRPRLVYTWKQNKGLSRVDMKFSGTKDYPLRSKDKETDKYLSPRNDSNVTSYSDGEESSVNEMSESDDINSESQTSDSEGFLSPDLSASPEKTMDTFKPLMMKIQTQNVSKCVTTDGRKLHVSDIVWGKIQGFPWWPGRIMSITITKKDNGLVIAQLAHIAWFGSSTRSHMQCDELFSFLEDFELRFNKKKRGPYKLAIRQATMAARRSTANSDISNSIELENIEN